MKTFSLLIIIRNNDKVGAWTYLGSKTGSTEMSLPTTWTDLRVVCAIDDSTETLSLFVTKLELTTIKPNNAKACYAGFGLNNKLNYAKFAISAYTNISRLQEVKWFNDDMTSSSVAYYFYR